MVLGGKTVANEQAEGGVWEAVLAFGLVAAMGIAVGFYAGSEWQYDKCGAAMDELQASCIANLDELTQTCVDAMDEIAVMCSPSIQQDRIWKWEQCFADKNCRACLAMGHNDLGAADVEWCHANAYFPPVPPIPDNNL